MSNKAKLAFLTMKRYSNPFTEKDLIDAIKFGEQLMLEKVEESMIGMNVNGIVQLVLTEQKLKDLTNE